MAKGMLGTYFHNIDAKGRLIIPQKIREHLGEEFVITMGFDGCLYVYSDEEWEKFTDKLSQLGNAKGIARDLQRFINSGACDCEFDSQGRTLIPQRLRDYAKLDKEVVVIGNRERAEIWSKDMWEEKQKSEAFNPQFIAAKLEELDINF